MGIPAVEASLLPDDSHHHDLILPYPLPDYGPTKYPVTSEMA